MPHEIRLSLGICVELVSGLRILKSLIQNDEFSYNLYALSLILKTISRLLVIPNTV